MEVIFQIVFDAKARVISPFHNIFVVGISTILRNQPWVTHNSITIGQIANINIFAKNVQRDPIYIDLVEFLLHKINFGNLKKIGY